MIVPKVSDIVGIINKIAPFAYAEGWDNVGLQVGDSSLPSPRIMISLDPGKDAVAAAIAQRCNLLLTHHPLLFNPLKKVVHTDPVGSVIAAALKHDLAIASLHTNYDIVAGGVNDLLAECLGITKLEPLKVTGLDEVVKLVVFVPKGHEAKVMESLFRFSGFIGNYSDCSFAVPGIGTFKPSDGARPFIGEIGRRESVEETRLEVLLRRADISSAVTAMVKAHPYEEPAFDLYPLLNEGKARGLGRIGRLPEPVALEQLARLVVDRLSLDGARYVGDPSKMVQKVALCGGSGMSLMRDAVFKGADVFITGDVKYHEARESQSLGLSLVDAGHFSSERLMIQGVTESLREEISKRNLVAEVMPFLEECEPFRFCIQE